MPLHWTEITSPGQRTPRRTRPGTPPQAPNCRGPPMNAIFLVERARSLAGRMWRGFRAFGTMFPSTHEYIGTSAPIEPGYATGIPRLRHTRLTPRSLE